MKAYRVYTMYGEGKSVLYVGMTSDLAERIRSHYRDKDWIESVAAIRASGPMRKADAAKREATLIRTLAPAHNRALPSGNMGAKIPTSFRFTPHAATLLARLSKEYRVPQAEVVEQLLREASRQDSSLRVVGRG